MTEQVARVPEGDASAETVQTVFDVRRGRPAADELAAVVVVLASVLRPGGADPGAAAPAARAPWTRAGAYRSPRSWRD
jgi:hypothetical protein